MRARVEAVAADMLGSAVQEIEIVDGNVYSTKNPSTMLRFADVVRECYKRGVGLSYSGQWTAPVSGWDRDTGLGRAYFAYTFGVAVSEVKVDMSSGETFVTKITAAYDVGRAINPQNIESVVDGGSIQGVGYALMEEIVHERGKVLNPSLSEYYIPTSVDAP